MQVLKMPYFIIVFLEDHMVSRAKGLCKTTQSKQLPAIVLISRALASQLLNSKSERFGE